MLKTHEVNSIMILDIMDDLDIANAAEVKQIIEDRIRDRNYNIIVNLQSVPLVTSRGMGTLITSQVKLRKYGGDLRICNISKQNQEVFRITKLNSIFLIFETEEEAIRSFD